jgi:ATP-dependent Clp protease ATP-binding subunit ClpC
LLRNLQRVHVDAMSVDDAFGVLDTLGRRMGKPHPTTVGPEALHGALALLARFGRHDALPGSGVALLEQMIRSWPGTTLERQHALDAFCAASGFPLKIVDDTQFIDEDALRASFHDRIIGQPDAVDRLVDLILVVKAGLGDPDKPLGSFLLMGPTGVGKTESAKALAGWLFGSQDRLVRLDMSEFGAWGSARRLIDGPGGQGLLTRKIREKPFCVLLLDEVEKAEPGVFDVLLQVLGEGRLTDGTGATVSFRHVIILMTSNLGASNRKRVGLVGESADAADRRYRRAAEDFFRPELVNRIDALVPFRSLDQHDVRTIARGMLTSALDRDGIRRRGVEVTWGDDLLDHLCEVGFDPRYGARPMKRAIDDHVMAVIARELVSRPDATRLALRVVDGAVVL